MLLSYAAKHVQFLDKTQELKFEVLKNGDQNQDEYEKQKTRFQEYCRKAEKEGHCLDNLSTFHILHVFPSEAGATIDKVKVEVDEENLGQAAPAIDVQ